jgi:hypothetical protein
MQNQKTETWRTPDELPMLSHKEAVFLEAIAAGDDNCTAFRKAWDAEGYSINALRVEACRRAASDKIQAHLRVLRAVGLDRAGVTLQGRIEAELAFAQRCENAGNYGAAGQAYDRLNKLAGLYPAERREVTVTSTPEQTLQELEAMIGGTKIEVRH